LLFAYLYAGSGACVTANKGTLLHVKILHSPSPKAKTSPFRKTNTGIYKILFCLLFVSLPFGFSQQTMSGIYIHIPVCKQKCHYCNFFSVASDKYRAIFVQALLKEIDRQKDYLEDKTIHTIYFGGGTPSMLSTKEINQILEKLNSLFTVSNDVEITLEANPDDLSNDKLKSLKNETAVNRLSMGVQSFFDDDLTYLNRVHSGNQARNAIELALKNQFDNLTIDLIYGIPTLTEDKWQKNLEIFLSYKLPHLSAYSLTVEPKTALNTLIQKKKMQPVDEEKAIRHFNILLEKTSKNDYVHYEISNFAKQGHYSKHNSIYWLGGH